MMPRSPSDRPTPRQDRLPDLKGTLTHDNLTAAFATDARATRLYALFARIAEIEGCPEAARALREMAEAQSLFADGHVDFLRRVGDPLTAMSIGETVLNLRSAVAAELQEAAEALPKMAETAHAEGFPDIASWFETLARAKRAHAEELQRALDITSRDASILDDATHRAP